MDACHIILLYKYTYCIVSFGEILFSSGGAAAGYIIFEFSLFTFRRRTRQETRIVLMYILLLTTDMRCALLWFLFHKTLFVVENEKPTQITIFKSNTAQI